MENQNTNLGNFSQSNANSAFSASPTVGVAPTTGPAPIASSPQGPQANQFQTTPSNGDKKQLIIIISLVIVSLIALTFIGLFIWMFIQWDDIKTDVDGQINAKVAEAVDENTTKLQAEFAEKERHPYKTFTGPADYGELSFEYPKTWSVYEEASASSGGDYAVYFNPDKVPTIDDDNIFALRVSILNELSENVIKDYSSLVEDGDMTLSIVPINGENANVYTGKFDNEQVGIAAIFRIRDKTVIMRTDATVFSEDFYHILSTVKYNK